MSFAWNTQLPKLFPALCECTDERKVEIGHAHQEPRVPEQGRWGTYPELMHTGLNQNSTGPRVEHSKNRKEVSQHGHVTPCQLPVTKGEIDLRIREPPGT